MKIFLFYFMLFALWAEHALHISLSQIKGLSLSNLAVYLLLFAWAFRIAFQRKFFDSNNVNKYLMLIIFIGLVSIPVKIWFAEIPNTSVLNEIIYWKNWADPFILFFVLFNIIDDEKSVRRTLSRFLEREGYNVMTAGGVEEARGLISGADLVLSDIRMGDGKNGIEFLEELKNQGFERKRK